MNAFEIYKPGQGVYARLAVVVMLGLVALFGLYELYGAIEAWEAEVVWGLQWKALIVAILAVAAGVGIALLANAHRPVDFLIVTEAELRKVSWPTARQLRQQTIIVLVTMFLLGLVIFLADWVFVIGYQQLYLR
ncbi:MAG TPA: preprotein translocase subunit SecE [Candidatus Brocadiia bacterium]|nr:preprotein translocase subunit SecE [Candidatus Brocadiia bacterium]